MNDRRPDDVCNTDGKIMAGLRWVSEKGTVDINSRRYAVGRKLAGSTVAVFAADNGYLEVYVSWGDGNGKWCPYAMVGGQPDRRIERELISVCV